MPQRCRVGDTGSGTCPSHDSPKPYTTVINTGAPTVLSNDQPSAVLGSVGIASCGHPTVALTGSASVLNENKGSHRVGDSGSNAGSYIMMVGSPNISDGN